MRLLSRLLQKVDDNLTHSIDLHVARAIPQPRSVSPDQVLHLTPTGQRLTVVAWDCCPCCKAYSPQPCPVIHPGPCDKPECNDPEDVA